MCGSEEGECTNPPPPLLDWLGVPATPSTSTPPEGVSRGGVAVLEPLVPAAGSFSNPCCYWSGGLTYSGGLV